MLACPIGPDLLRRAQRLRWIQAPAAAPPAGYYYQELIAIDVVVTNQLTAAVAP